MKANSLTGRLAMVLACLGSVAALSACSVEASAPPIVGAITTPEGTLGTPSTPSNPAAKAMGAEGKWETGCYYDQGTHMRETMTLKDNDIKIQVEGFFGGSCTGTPGFKADLTGIMAYRGSNLALPAGHNVEIVMTQPDGKVETLKVLFLLENGTLYTSDNANSTSWPGYVNRSRAYKKVAGV